MVEEKTDDRQLVRRCLNRDEDAWNMLIRKHERRVYNLCYQFFGRAGTAEDAAQDVFVKVYGALNRYNFDMEFSTWLMAVTRNLCIDKYRHSRREKLVDMDHVAQLAAPAEGGPMAALSRQEAQQRVHEGLRLVGDELRMAVILRDIQGYSYDEIAAITASPIGTVKSRINRGRLELARVLLQKQNASAAAGARSDS